MERAKASELESPEQLPELEGEEIIIEWDFEDREKQGEDCWTVLRHNGREIWREVAYYEGRGRSRLKLFVPCADNFNPGRFRVPQGLECG